METKAMKVNIRNENQIFCQPCILIYDDFFEQSQTKKKKNAK